MKENVNSYCIIIITSGSRSIIFLVSIPFSLSLCVPLLWRLHVVFLQHKANNAERGETAPTATMQQRGKRKATTASNEGFITEENGFVVCVSVCVHPYVCALIVTRNKHKHKHSDGLREETRPHNCRKEVNGFLWRE